MLEAVKQAQADGNSVLANEITANVMVGTTMMLIFVAMLICLLLNEVGVFSADKAAMRWAVLLASVVEVPITVLNSIYVGTKSWLKIPLMVDLILASLLVLCFSNDIFTGYVFIEICTISSCGLLMIRRNGEIVCNYDRGWDVEPGDPDTQMALEILLHEYNW